MGPFPRPLGDAAPAARHGLQLFLLGTFRVLVDAQPVDAAKWRRRKASALIKLLALTPAHRLHREEIAALLWPEAAPTAASNNFHQALYLARHALGVPGAQPARWLRLEEDVLSLSPDEPVWIDVEAFEAAAAQARRGRDPQLYRRALDLFSGELLPEDRYADWAVPRREVLQRESIQLKIGLAEACQARGELESAGELLRQVLAELPHHEPAHRALMALYAQRGERDRALAQFETLRQALQAELAAEPDPATRRLYEEIRAGPWHAPPPPASRPATNLPASLTSFIGRERELIEVERLLRANRLLTLTGPGGCGKTRLALEVARALAPAFAQGTWFVDLAPLADPAFVPRAAADALGIGEGAEISITETLVTVLRTRQALIVLDNCEHLVEACAYLCHTLLRACPQVHILATSRGPLRLTGEIVWLVPSLELPNLQRLPRPPELNDIAAVRLFVERARAASAGFGLTLENAAAVAQLCVHLDGIPLALELAAARVSVLSVEQILARLDDRFRLLTLGSRAALNRQQTLQAAIDWSYDLLSDEERALFRRLSVFVGGCTLEAVEAVCAAGPAQPDTLVMLLSRLIDNSLLRVESQPERARYHLLETIRHYSLERLEASPESSSARQRHADYYLALATAGGSSRIFEFAPAEWLDRLEAELDNLRAALGWCLRAGDDSGDGLHLVVLLYRFWSARGYVQECRTWLERALAHSATTSFPDWRAMALLGLGWVLVTQGEYRAAEDCLEDSCRLVEKQADRHAQAAVLNRLGWLARERGDTATARLRLENSAALCRVLGDMSGLASALVTLGEVGVMEGDAEWATALFTEALTKFQALGERDGIGWTLNHLGHVAQLRGEFGRARQLHAESLELFLRISPQYQGVADAHENMGETAIAEGNAALARRHFGAGLQLARDRGYRTCLSWCLAGLAGTLADDQPEQAARLWGAAEALRRAIGVRPAPASGAARVRLQAAALAALGEATFAAAWAQGERMALDEAVALALAIAG
jgi:predicted ATPase/DNA-binding SARP family transcriptional activator